MEARLVEIINEYVQVGFARDLAVFFARYLPIVIIVSIAIYLFAKLEPGILKQIRNERFFSILFKLVINAFVFIYFVFWRYVFGISREPKFEPDIKYAEAYDYSLEKMRKIAAEFSGAIFLLLDVILSIAFSLVTVNIIKEIFQSPRPFIALSEINSLFVFGGNDSFPSGHSAIFFSLAVVIYKYNKELGIVYGFCAILIGLARVAAGVHFFTDIVFGFLVGYIVAKVIQKNLFVRLRKKYGVY